MNCPHRKTKYLYWPSQIMLELRRAFTEGYYRKPRTIVFEATLLTIIQHKEAQFATQLLLLCVKRLA